MVSIKNKQSGFTIVELLIVIVVIGILAGLVITTFAGIQQKARNTERQTDIKAVYGQLEAYYAQNGKYPTFSNLNTNAWRVANMKGLDNEAIKDPKGAGSGAATSNLAPYQVAATPAASIYSYAVFAADGTTACDNVTTDCAVYALTATYEGSGTFAKTNLN